MFTHVNFRPIIGAQGPSGRIGACRSEAGKQQTKEKSWESSPDSYANDKLRLADC